MNHGEVYYKIFLWQWQWPDWILSSRSPRLEQHTCMNGWMHGFMCNLGLGSTCGKWMRCPLKSKPVVHTFLLPTSPSRSNNNNSMSYSLYGHQMFFLYKCSSFMFFIFGGGISNLSFQNEKTGSLIIHNGTYNGLWAKFSIFITLREIGLSAIKPYKVTKTPTTSIIQIQQRLIFAVCIS